MNGIIFFRAVLNAALPSTTIPWPGLTRTISPSRPWSVGPSYCERDQSQTVNTHCCRFFPLNVWSSYCCLSLHTRKKALSGFQGTRSWVYRYDLPPRQNADCFIFQSERRSEKNSSSSCDTTHPSALQIPSVDLIDHNLFSAVIYRSVFMIGSSNSCNIRSITRLCHTH